MKKKHGLGSILVITLLLFLVGFVISILTRSSLLLTISSIVSVAFFWISTVVWLIVSTKNFDRNEYEKKILDYPDHESNSSFDRRIKDIQDSQLREDIRKIRDSLDK